MPQGSRRRAIFILLSILCVLPGVMAESLSPSTTGSLRGATTQFMIIERQLPGIVITLSLPLPTPTPLATNPFSNGTPIPLLISPVAPPTPPPSVSVSRSSSSSPSITSTTSTSAQSSQSGNSTTTANTANNSNRLTAINFLPFIILTSFFIVSLMGWCLHGWCTRRPKEKFVTMGTMESRKKRGGWFGNRDGQRGEENEELVYGPAYVSFVGQDVEEFATVRQSGRYRWPPLSVTNQGDQHQVSQNKLDDGPILSESVPFEFAEILVQTIRSVPSAEPREANVGKKLMSPTTTTGPMSPTSIALRDLYEVVLRNDYEGPNTGGAEERTALLGVGSGVLNANRSTSGRKRKGHVRQGSESRDGTTQFMDLGGRWSDDGGNRLPRKKLEVRNPSVGEGRLGLREGVGLVSDGILNEEDEDDYTPLPTPTRLVRQFSFGGPPSRVPKPGGESVQYSQKIPFSISMDVLPAHPKQITSPPLENQMYFVPLPITVEPNVVGLASPPARVRGSVRPKATVLESREKYSGRNNGLQNPSEAVDDRPVNRGLATTSPLKTIPGSVKNKQRDIPSRRDGASKGKGKLVKIRPAAVSSAMNQTGED